MCTHPGVHPLAPWPPSSFLTAMRQKHTQISPSLYPQSLITQVSPSLCPQSLITQASPSLNPQSLIIVQQRLIKWGIENSQQCTVSWRTYTHAYKCNDMPFVLREFCHWRMLEWRNESVRRTSCCIFQNLTMTGSSWAILSRLTLLTLACLLDWSCSWPCSPWPVC